MVATHPRSPEPSSFSHIARMLPPEPARVVDRGESQVVLLDIVPNMGHLEQQLVVCQAGVWLRHARPFSVGTKVVLHLLLEELFAPLTLEGMVAKVIQSEDRSNPWMLVWFLSSSSEAVQKLQHCLKERQQ